METKNKKYQLLHDDTTYVCGKLLYRIKANISFDYVKKGDLGGYIQDLSNLSEDGTCWIDSKSSVFGDATVKDDAYLKNSIVCNGSQICGNALIKNSKIDLGAKVFEHAMIIDSIIKGNGCEIFGKACVEDTQIRGNSKISGSSNIKSSTIKDGTINGEAKIEKCTIKNAIAGGTADIYNCILDPKNLDPYTICTKIEVLSGKYCNETFEDDEKHRKKREQERAENDAQCERDIKRYEEWLKLQPKYTEEELARIREHEQAEFDAYCEWAKRELQYRQYSIDHDDPYPWWRKMD